MSKENADGGASVSALARRDEVLELLFWMRGQGFGDELTLADLKKFLSEPDEEILRTLESLERLGAVDRHEDRFALTDAWLSEAHRRFVDDFKEMLAGGHGECNLSCEGAHEHDVSRGAQRRKE